MSQSRGRGQSTESATSIKGLCRARFRVSPFERGYAFEDWSSRVVPAGRVVLQKLAGGIRFEDRRACPSGIEPSGNTGLLGWVTCGLGDGGEAVERPFPFGEPTDGRCLGPTKRWSCHKGCRRSGLDRSCGVPRYQRSLGDETPEVWSRDFSGGLRRSPKVTRPAEAGCPM